MTVIRDLWERHLGPRRAASLALATVAYCLCVLALALTPGFALDGDDPAWLAKFGPVLGGAAGMALRGYVIHRTPRTWDGLRWGLAQGGLMALAILVLYVLAGIVNPIVRPNQSLGGEAWLGLMAVALVMGTTSNVLWERNRRRKRIAVLLLVAVCLLIVGLAGLWAGRPWSLVGIPPLVFGLIALVLAVLAGWSDLIEAAADPRADSAGA